MTKIKLLLYLLAILIFIKGCEVVPFGDWSNPVDSLNSDELVLSEVKNFSGTPGNGEVILTWSNPEDDNFDHVEIWYGIGNTDTEYTGNKDNAGTTIQELLDNTEYTFIIKSVDDSNINKSKGVEISISTLNTLPPGEVTDLTAISGDRIVTLSWINPTDSDFSHVDIWYGIGNAGSKYTGSIVPEGTVIIGLANNSEYIFKIFTVDTIGNVSDGKDISAIPADIFSPSEVSDFLATSGDTLVTLSWTNPTDSDFSHVEIWYGIGNTDTEYTGTKIPIGTVITGLTNNSEYTFKIVSIDNSGNSTIGVEATSIPADITPPGEVTSLSAISGDELVTLSWTNPTDSDFSHVEIWYGIGNTDTEYTGSKNPLGTVITNLTGNIEYTFKIFTVDNSGNISNGLEIVSTPADDITPPSEVTEIVATAGDQLVTLSWTNPTESDFSHVEIWYGIGNTDTEYTGTKIPIGTVITGLTNNSEYTFKIVSIDNSGNSTIGVEATSIPADITPPGEVTSLSAISGDELVTLSWTNPTDSDFSHVEIWYGIGNTDTEYTGSKNPLGTVITGLTNNSSYTFKIVSLDNSGNYSAGVMITSTSGILFSETVSVIGGSYTQTAYAGDFQHTISDFSIGAYEVTYDLWYTVYSWAIINGYSFDHAGTEGYDGTEGADPTSAKYEPVTGIDWRDTIVWCNAYSEMTGRTPVFENTSGVVIKDSRDSNASECDSTVPDWNANGFRLPTEGEWHFAASGGISSNGYTYSGSNTIDDVAWYRSNSSYNTHNVAEKQANELSLYDMSGNVSEWCFDWYGSYPGESTDYRGPSSGSHRMLLGGDWFSDLTNIFTVFYRGYYEPFGKGGNFGFRLAHY